MMFPKKIAVVLSSILIGVNVSLAQSLAHERSAYAIIDPVYSSQSANPPTNLSTEGAAWIYGAGELEWASVSAPTKYGDITVDLDQESVAIRVPPGTVLEWEGNLIQGPATLNETF